jgi:hypothetical protein
LCCGLLLFGFVTGAGAQSSVPNIGGAWVNQAAPNSGPAWQLTVANGLQTLNAMWTGAATHSGLHGAFTGTLVQRSGASAYEGTFKVTEGEVIVEGTGTFTITTPNQIKIDLIPTNGHGYPSHYVFVRTSGSVPITVAAAPLAAAFGAVVQVEVPPGGDGLAASPPLENTSAATVTEEGLSPEDTTIAALVTYAALRHQCYVTAVARVVIFYKLNQRITAGVAQDEAALEKLNESIAEGIPKYIQACLAYVDAAVASPAATASASTCPITPLTIISRRRAGKTSISKIHSGAAKGLSVTCSRRGGVLTMHLATKAGRPLSKFVGSRLRLAVARSKHDSGAATVSFSFHKG